MTPLRSGGIDIFYLDESERHPLAVVTAVRIPFLRNTKRGWQFVWEDWLKAAEDWRRDLSANHKIRFREELHAYKILKCQGLFKKTWKNLSPAEAVDLYRAAMRDMAFLPSNSVMSTFTTGTSTLAGATGIEACLVGMFQRIRSQCNAKDRNGLIFFDDGHYNYIHHFRRAQKYLPTGSMVGHWSQTGKATINAPLSMFPKDGNLKRSALSYFLQMADLIAYAVRLKLEYETGTLAAQRVRRKHHRLYDALPISQVNTKATRKRRDGVVPI